MKNKFFVFLVTIATFSCNEQGATSAATDSTAQTTTETAAPASAQDATENYPAEIIGSFSGQQVSYNLKNKDGNDMIIRGNPVTVPGYSVNFTLNNNGSVEFIQQAAGVGRVYYNGSFKVLENSGANIQVQCDVSTSDKTSNPTYILNFDKSTNEITCSGGNSEPIIALTRSGNSASSEQSQGGNSDQLSESQNQSPDGIYIYSDNSVNIRIAINGNRWRGKTMIISGFGADNDNQNAQYDNGVVNGTTLFDASGYVEIGHVNGRNLTTTISDQSVTLRKQ
jgi:hypothetical protein